MHELVVHPFAPDTVTQYIPGCVIVVVLVVFMKFTPFLDHVYGEEAKAPPGEAIMVIEFRVQVNVEFKAVTETVGVTIF